MNPEQVLETQDERTRLERLMQAFANQRPTAEERRNAFIAAGLALLNVQLAAAPGPFGTALASALASRPVSLEQPERHPLPVWLNYLLADPDSFGIFDDDVEFLRGLVDQTIDRSRALAARQSVGRIEDEAKVGFGTGVLVHSDLLLTCNHIFTKANRTKAWARFGFKINHDGRSRSEGVRFELNIAQPERRGGGMQPDYILLRVLGNPQRPAYPLAQVAVSRGQTVRMIHHPRGRPAEVSEPGQIRHVDDSYLLHDIPAEDGSSGAPLFREDWTLIALHRGSTPNVKDTRHSEAVPVNAFFNLVVERL